MIAHELAQPLSAISYYLEGAMELVKRQHDETGLLASSLEKSGSRQTGWAQLSARFEATLNRTRSVMTVWIFPARLLPFSQNCGLRIGNVKVASSVPVGLAVQGILLKLSSCSGISSKNATEAALGTEHPEIEITGQERTVSFPFRSETAVR